MIEIGTTEAKRLSALQEEEIALPHFLATLAALGVANNREDHEVLGCRGGPGVRLLWTHAFETSHWRVATFMMPSSPSRPAITNRSAAVRGRNRSAGLGSRGEENVGGRARRSTDRLREWTCLSFSTR